MRRGGPSAPRAAGGRAGGRAGGGAGGGASNWLLAPPLLLGLLLLCDGLTAAGLPPADKSTADKQAPDHWDGHITYDFSHQKTAQYGGKITGQSADKAPPPSKAAEDEEGGGGGRGEASCPPPTNRCQGPACQSDADCPKAGSACCFNGCIKTCSFLVDPPAVVDWLEESPALSPALYDKDALEERKMSDRDPDGDAALLESVTAPDVVTLDGCVLTAKQKEHLDELRQSSSIGSCFCQDGDVSCHVQHKDDAASSLQGHLVLRNT